MEREKLENVAEAALLIAFFTLILYLGPAAAADRTIMHDHPVGYAASDSFQHQARAESIKQMGQYRQEAPYLVAGLTDIVGFYPPVLYHLTALLSNLTGLETYDALMLLIGLAIALGAITAYYFAGSLGKAVAALALPMTLFMATGKSFLGAVTFGQMPFVLSAAFLLATAWAMTKLSQPRGWILVSIFLAATIMTHTSEAIFLAILIALIFAAAAATKKKSISGIKQALRENKQLIIALTGATAITLYFLPMFIGIWVKALPYKFGIEKTSASFPAATVFPKDYGLMALLLMAGVVFALLFAIQKRAEIGNIVQSRLFPLLFGIYLLIAGYGTYAGFGLRSFQLRLAWPLFLAPLAGFGAYQTIKFLQQRFFKNSNHIIYVAVAIIISTAVIAKYYEEPSTGSVGKGQWDAMKWVSENTPEDATVYVTFSPLYFQTSSLYNTQRRTYFLEQPNYIMLVSKLAEGSSDARMTPVTIPSDSGPGFPYRTGLLSFDRHITTTKTSDIIDICSADYYIIDKAFESQIPPQANPRLLLQNAGLTIELDNSQATVLKNNNKGGDCIGALQG